MFDFGNTDRISAFPAVNTLDGALLGLFGWGAEQNGARPVRKIAGDFTVSAALAAGLAYQEYSLALAALHPRQTCRQFSQPFGQPGAHHVCPRGWPLREAPRFGLASRPPPREAARPRSPPRYAHPYAYSFGTNLWGQSRTFPLDLNTEHLLRGKLFSASLFEAAIISALHIGNGSITPNWAPRATTSSFCTRSCDRVPDAGASISTMALSVSTSSTHSPFLT